MSLVFDEVMDTGTEIDINGLAFVFDVGMMLDLFNNNDTGFWLDDFTIRFSMRDNGAAPPEPPVNTLNWDGTGDLAGINALAPLPWSEFPVTIV
jgi:hypothetical protein